jgi:hypothetical protein
MGGLGTLVLFQALMNPTRLILGVAAALTFGGILTDTATSDAKDRVASKNTQSLLLDIRTCDCGRMLITLSGVGDRITLSSFSDTFE